MVVELIEDQCKEENKERSHCCLLYFLHFLPKQICRLNTETLYYEILIFQIGLKEKNVCVIQLDRHPKKTKISCFNLGNLDIVINVIADEISATGRGALIIWNLLPEN